MESKSVKAEISIGKFTEKKEKGKKENASEINHRKRKHV